MRHAEGARFVYPPDARQLVIGHPADVCSLAIIFGVWHDSPLRVASDNLTNRVAPGQEGASSEAD